VLEQIIRLFEDTEKKTKGLSRRFSESDFSVRMRELCGKMKDLSTSRMNKAHMKKGLIAKTKWALFTRDDCTKLVDDIRSLVNELIASFPADRVVKKREQLCEADAAALAETDGDVVALLKEALGKDDEQLSGALGKAVKSGDQNTANFTGDGNKGLQLGQYFGDMKNTRSS
jgi:hypothetical protein